MTRVSTSSHNLNSYIRRLHEAIRLLHYLIHYPDPIANLRNKIYHARSRQFNGLVHIFTVTFGRLSYARPPEWISLEGVAELEQLTGQRLSHTYHHFGP